MRAGLVAEWETPDALLRAVELLRRRGYTRLDAFTPFPVPGLDERLSLPRSPLTWIVFPFALGAAFTGYLIQWYCNARSYPLNVGGRPPHAAPTFIPITFETTVLFTAIAALLVLFLLLRFPALSHPLFAVEGFERASIDRYWLAIDATDPRFEAVRAAEDLRAGGPIRVERFGEDLS